MTSISQSQNVGAIGVRQQTNGLIPDFLPVPNFNTGPSHVLTKFPSVDNSLSELKKPSKSCLEKGTTKFDKPVLDPYPVQSKTLKEANDNAEVPGHPGLTGVTIPTFKVEYVLNDKNRIVCANVLVSLTIRYPQWIEECKQCKSIRDEWDAFVKRTLEHENGHVSYLTVDLANIHKIFFNEQLTGNKDKDAGIITQIIIDKISPKVEISDIRFHNKFGKTITPPDVNIGCGSGPFKVQLSTDTTEVACLVGTSKLFVAQANFDGFVSVIDPNANKINTTIPVDELPDIMANDFIDNKLYVAHLRGSEVSVINTTSNQLLKTMIVANYDPESSVRPLKILFDSSHEKIYLLDSAGAISIIDTNTDTVKKTIRQEFGINDMVLDTDDNKLYFKNYPAGIVYAVGTDTDEIESSVSVGEGTGGTGVNRMVMDTVNNKIYVSHSRHDGGVETQWISVIDSSTMLVKKIINLQNEIGGMAVDSTHGIVYVPQISNSISVPSSVSVISTLTDDILESITVASDPTPIRIVYADPIHNKLYLDYGRLSITAPQTIFILDTSTYNVLASIPNLFGIDPPAYDSVDERLYFTLSNTSGGVGGAGRVVTFIDSNSNAMGDSISVPFGESMIFTVVPD